MDFSRRPPNGSDSILFTSQSETGRILSASFFRYGLAGKK